MNIRKIILVFTLFTISAVTSAFADGTKDEPEVQYKYQYGLDFQVKLAKGLKINIEPQLRYKDGYDKMLLSGGVSYKTFDCIYWGATYRFVFDREESSSSSYNTSVFMSNNYDTQTYHYYAFDVTYKDKFGRFTPSFRVRYNNYSDDDIDDKEYLRYRAKVEYDIPKCKITPFLSAEAYQEMEENLLYKTRYSAGFDFKTGKRSALSFEYKFDFFALEYKNVNIFSFGYKFKF